MAAQLHFSRVKYTKFELSQISFHLKVYEELRSVYLWNIILRVNGGMIYLIFVEVQQEGRI